MAIYKDDIQRAQELKEIIENANHELQGLARQTRRDVANRYDAYIKGALEQVCEKFTPMGNFSIECLIQEMKDQYEDEQHEAELQREEEARLSN